MKTRSSPPKILLGLLALAAAASCASAAEGGYEWMPAQAEDAKLGADETSTKQVVLPVLETKIPKATADLSKFTKEYVIDLKKFGISNDGTNAEQTSKGLNAALQEARESRDNRIVFPKGTYLISENDPVIFNHEDTVVDLNGSILKINPNGLPDYSLAIIADEAKNFRLTNGTLWGDRDTHDYKTIKATHEHCRLLRFAGGRELEIDHLTICNAPGFAVTTTPTGGTPGRPGLLAMIAHWVLIRDLESGAFAADGQEIKDPIRVRTVKEYDLTKCGGEFEFGWSEGYMGFPFIKDRNYQTVFYDQDRKFLEKRDCVQFKKITVPTGAKYARLEFNQPEVSLETNHPGATSAGHCGRITNFRPPTDVHFHHNTMVYNRALGLAYTGGINWILENNHFERNGGQAPSFAVDYEDGWELMQNVIFRKNTFSNNANDLVVCAGTELLFEDNQFEKAVIVHGRAFNYTFRKNRFAGSVSYGTRSGILKIHDNHYENCKHLHLTFDGKGLADGFLRLPGTNIATPAIELKNETLVNIPVVKGTYFKFLDSKMDDVHFLAGKETVLAWFQNCKLNGSSITFEKEGPPVTFFEGNNQGTLEQKGPGMERITERKNLTPGR